MTECRLLDQRSDPLCIDFAGARRTALLLCVRSVRRVLSVRRSLFMCANDLFIWNSISLQHHYQISVALSNEVDTFGLWQFLPVEMRREMRHARRSGSLLGTSLSPDGAAYSDQLSPSWKWPDSGSRESAILITSLIWTLFWSLSWNTHDYKLQWECIKTANIMVACEACLALRSNHYLWDNNKQFW
jgi:hypothetical protein